MKPIDRRRFLTSSLIAVGGAAGAAGAIAGAETNAGAATPDDAAGVAAARAGLLEAVAFDGRHQAGVVNPAPAQATFAAFDAVSPNAAELRSALQALSYKARALARGERLAPGMVDDPTPDSGTLGSVVAPDSLTVTIGFGASLFDDRYGLGSKLPDGLTPMPPFATDQLVERQTHGDVIVQICAGQRDTVVHTLRELTRATRGELELRWAIDGFQSARRGPLPHSSTRNLFAFRDGTANPETKDASVMNRLVWRPDGSTIQVVRIIRMHVEFWDRVGLREQENMIGRFRDSGAPLGGTHEYEDPRFDLDPKGDRIGLDAHIRLANPRTDKTAAERLLRRGYNYHRGFDSAGALDQGLIFSAFNRDPAQQFAAIQKRLSDEPMIDYITPVGGGYFWVAPGTGGISGWAGQTLFA
jgi:deferrochelatase/peroxidase EfeB